ncbi:MAG TPA: GNAT family N-acetyltransferase [Solirubrobacteraceae bacterium]|nr:GNAT family N-acetyltransferase [Solirubrobacteraceae bacterium]
MRIESIRTLALARTHWEALELMAGSVFSSWEWAAAWWAMFGVGKQLELRSVYDGDRLVAILPLYRTRYGGVPVLRLLGHGAADELGPICDRADLPLAIDALHAVATDALPAHGFMVVDRLRDHGHLAKETLGSTIRIEASPTLPREGRSYDDWLAGRSANFRQQIRRRTKRLVRDHGLTFRRTTDPLQLEDDLDTLVALYHARWAEVHTTAFERSREAYHRAFARRALERGWLRLWIAEADGRPVAAWYGFCFAGDTWYYQAGRDPAWDRFAVGTVLLVHTIRSAFDDDHVNAYRFGVGDESYKARFGAHDPTLLTMAIGHQIPVGVSAAAVRAVTRVPPRLRRFVTQRLA